MAIQAYQEQSPYENDDLEQAKKQTKRLRWATHRANNKDGLKKRQSILNRLHKRSPSNTTNGGAPQTELKTETTAAEESGVGRTIYFNIPLPASDKDEEGHPIVTYTRNKIRTAKYTPLSFVPKNLWFQFHNIANIYFLFIIILCVSCHVYEKRMSEDLLVLRFLQSLALRILDLTQFLLSSFSLLQLSRMV